MSYARAIRDRAMKIQFPAECVDGYLDWYIIVSHSHIVPPRQHEDDAGPSHVGSLHDGSSHSDTEVPSNDMAHAFTAAHMMQITLRWRTQMARFIVW